MTEPKSRRIPKRLLLAFACVVVVGIAYFGYSIYRTVNEVVPNAYAQWWVADMAIEYMERNEGFWPRNWEDLREPYEICAGRSGQPWSFDELRSRVAIDFDADPAQLVKASAPEDGPPFRVIYLRSGKRHHWEGKEPNRMILEYLKERAHRPESYVYPKRPHPDEKEARAALLALGAEWRLDTNGRVTSVNMGSATGSPRYSDAAMAHLKPLKDLRELILGYSNVSDDGLKHIRELANLERIYLYGTKVSDAGLEHLVGMEKLEMLVLADDNFTDLGLEHIQKMTNLKLLNLNSAKVTDKGLAKLHGLKNLDEILLGDTDVTDEGVRKFQRAHPNCEVYHP